MPDFHCPTCYKKDFRASRVRPEDRVHLLLFKLPVRCKHCRARTYAPRSFAKLLRSSTPTRTAAASAQLTASDS